MTEQGANHKINRREQLLQDGAQMLSDKPLTPAEQMAEDMVVYFAPDRERSDLMLDYLASLQEEIAKPH